MESKATVKGSRRPDDDNGAFAVMEKIGSADNTYWLPIKFNDIIMSVH